MTHRTVFDALIVGAGPAGAYLGYLLAGRGHNVAVIDKSPFPRDKVCGGGVSRKAAALLEFDIAPVVQHRIRGAYLTFRNSGGVFKEVDPPAACTVLRREFDNFLLEKACAAGAQFFPSTSFIDMTTGPEMVSVQTNRGEFHGHLVLAADGVASAVRGKVFAKSIVRYAPALEALVYGAGVDDMTFDDRALFDFGGMPRGYGWIFPKRDHLNVGVYSPFGGHRMPEHLAAFMARYACLRHPHAIRYQGFAIPVQNTPGLFQRGRVWLIGDAAGLADALFGEGIYFALKSAALAAQALDETGFAPDSLRYTRLVKQVLVPELRASQWLGRGLFAFPDFAFSHLVTHPRVNDSFAGVISGAVGYRECLSKTLVGWPNWLFGQPPTQTVPDL